MEEKRINDRQFGFRKQQKKQQKSSMNLEEMRKQLQSSLKLKNL